MKDVLERIKAIINELKEKFGDRIIFDECSFEDDHAAIFAKIDGKKFTITYTDNEFFRVIISSKNFLYLEELLTPVITKNIRRRNHIAYNINFHGRLARVLEWDTVKSFKERKQEILNNGPVNGVTFYYGTSKQSPSLLAFRHELIFTPLPKEQRLTEDGLLNFERKIAKIAAKNERMQILSEKYAEKSGPCMASGDVASSETEKKRKK